MWVLVLYVLASGQSFTYKDTFPTAQACVDKRVEVKAELVKNNPQVRNPDEVYVLLCEPAKKKP